MDLYTYYMDFVLSQLGYKALQLFLIWDELRRKVGKDGNTHTTQITWYCQYSNVTSHPYFDGFIPSMNMVKW